MKPIYNLVLAVICTPWFFSTSNFVQSADCNVTYTDSLGEPPPEIIEIVESLIVYDTRLSAYTYLATDLPLFVPSDFEAYNRFGAVKLSPFENYVFTPYLDESNNALLHFTDLEKLGESIPIVSSPDWQIDKLSAPYWLDHLTVVVAVRVNSNTYRFDLVQPKSDITQISLEFENELPSPRRHPILSADGSHIVYVSLIDSKDRLIVYDVVEEKVTSETVFDQIDAVGVVQWSPSGNYLAFQHMNSGSGTSSISVISKTNDELVSIDDGLSSPHTTADSVLFQWSPDDTNIMYLSRDDEQDWSQILVNVETKERTQICIPGKAYFTSNGEHIVLTMFDETRETGSSLIDVFVYDVLNKQLYQIDTIDLSDVGSVLGLASPVG